MEHLNIYLLMFADDAALLSETANGLQKSFDDLNEYCLKWILSINIDKTKIVVFRKGGQLGGECKWSIDGKEIEIVSTFNYLGVVFSSGGSFVHPTKTLACKALRAMGSLFSITKNIEVPVNIMFNLFDAFVSSFNKTDIVAVLVTTIIFKTLLLNG